MSTFSIVSEVEIRKSLLDKPQLKTIYFERDDDAFINPSWSNKAFKMIPLQIWHATVVNFKTKFNLILMENYSNYADTSIVPWSNVFYKMSAHRVCERFVKTFE